MEDRRERRDRNRWEEERKEGKNNWKEGGKNKIKIDERRKGKRDIE